MDVQSKLDGGLSLGSDDDKDSVLSSRNPGNPGFNLKDKMSEMVGVGFK